MREPNRQVPRLRNFKQILVADLQPMSFRTSADYGPFYAGSTDFCEICVNLRFSLGLPRSRLEALTNTMSREYIP